MRKVMLLLAVVLASSYGCRTVPEGGDDAAPVVSLQMEAMTLLSGEATLPIVIEEADVATIRLFNQDGELLSVNGPVDELRWDTTTVSSQLHSIYVEVTDGAGNTATTADIPVVVTNSGEEITVEYIPEASVAIPDPFNPHAEIHTRTVAMMDERPIERVIAWVTWDEQRQWPVEFAVGQGLGAHRGISYIAEESSDGRIVIDLRPSDLTSESIDRVQAQMASYSGDATSFPYNGDPATLGAFFGHINPLNPEEHIGEEMAIEVHFVFFYAN